MVTASRHRTLAGFGLVVFSIGASGVEPLLLSYECHGRLKRKGNLEGFGALESKACLDRFDVLWYLLLVLGVFDW